MQNQIYICKMGNRTSVIQNINLSFEDVQKVDYLIHIFDNDNSALIKRTLKMEQEVELINRLISEGKYDNSICIYGKNMDDADKLFQRQKQLADLGFKHVFIYLGGLFEWALLHDIYGNEMFPFTVVGPDPLLFKPLKKL